MSSTSEPSPQLCAVLSFYDAVTNWKFDVLDELFADDYIHDTYPSSANVPPKSKTEGIEHAKAIGALLGYTPLKARRASIKFVVVIISCGTVPNLPIERGSREHLGLRTSPTF